MKMNQARVWVGVGSSKIKHWSETNFYSPHPKDMEGTFFTGVCLSTSGGGDTPVPGSFQVTDPRSSPGGPDLVRMGYPLGQNSRLCGCYAAGGMPLAFTKEDCLLVLEFLKSDKILKIGNFRNSPHKNH